MKKLFMLIGLTLGLTGMALAQSDNTWVTPQPLKNYLYTTNSFATGEFFNLNTAYTVDNGAITVSAAATANGIENVFPFGEGLAAGTSLNNLFFGYDNGEWTSVTRTGTDSKAKVFRLADIGLTDFSFMEKKVTGLILSAGGGVYFTDDASGATGEMTLPDPLADLNDMAISYAVRAYAAKVTYNMGEPVKSSAAIKNIANLPVGILAVGKDNLTQLPYCLVQYNYLVNNDTLIYQIKLADDGLVECKIAKQNKLKSSSDDALYNLCLDMKRESDTLAFGGNSIYVITKGLAGWQCNVSQSLEKRRLAIYPKGGTINGTSAYTSINATVVLSEKSKEALTNATSLLAFVTPRSSATPKFENKAYAVGDEVENSNDFRTPYRVVYNGKPANLNDISFVVSDLNPNEKYYLYAYLCQKDGDNYRYSTDVFVFSDDILTRPMETPADVTIGKLNGDNIPLTFSASPFKLLILKSDSVQSGKPQGVLAVGDRDGNVIAILDKGVTSCNIPMTPGEMTYLQMYAMTDDEIPGYSSNFTLVPLYRQAEQLPLRYDFGPKDEIPQTYDRYGVLTALPMLPPGLSTSSTQPDNAFFVGYIDNLDHTFYLRSRKTAKTPAWPNVILPAFSGVKNIQVSFMVKFYTPNQLGGLSAGVPDKTDSVRIEYRLNGGEWQTAGLFSKSNMPEALGDVYPLSASFSCQTDDVVNIRYSYYTAYSETSFPLHAIASYEIAEQRDCETPTALQMVSDGTTNTAIALKWKDEENVPAAGNYVVSYQKAAEAAEEDENTEADTWMTQTSNKTEAVLSGLEANTAYNVKVQAVCATGPSAETTPVRMSTPAAMPYIENMDFVWDDDAYDYSRTPDLTAYNGELGGELEADDYMSSSTTWSIDYNRPYASEEAPDPDGLGVATDMAHALLATPAVYVRKTSVPMPKTLTFRVNTYDRATVNDQRVYNNGIDLVDPDLRLYVLASTDGTFTWADTVAAFDHNALKAEAAAKDGQRGKELAVELTEPSGLVQFAFYFHNPNPFTYDNENDGEATFPMYLELLGISFRYDGGDNPCFPVENLKATNVKETRATLNWNGDGAEYGITYYPANDATQAKTVYQDATEAELQTITLEELMSNTTYNADVVSYCTKGDRTGGSVKATTTFKTQREMFEVTVTITPEDAGKVNDENPYSGYYFDGTNVTLRASANPGYKFAAWMDGETELSKDSVYKFSITANVTYTAKFEAKQTYELTLTASPAEGGTVEGAGRYEEGEEVTVSAKATTGYKFVAWTNGNDTLGKTATYTFPMPSADVTYTAVFRDHTGIEDMVRASFSVSTDHGRLIVRNLNGILVKDIDVYGLTGNRIHRFTPNSREDLMLPLDAGHALVFVRLSTEKGAAVYKVYVH